jgi:hypothetical protein
VSSPECVDCASNIARSPVINPGGTLPYVPPNKCRHHVMTLWSMCGRIKWMVPGGSQCANDGRVYSFFTTKTKTKIHLPVNFTQCLFHVQVPGKCILNGIGFQNILVTTPKSSSKTPSTHDILGTMFYKCGSHIVRPGIHTGLICVQPEADWSVIVYNL